MGRQCTNALFFLLSKSQLHQTAEFHPHSKQQLAAVHLLCHRWWNHSQWLCHFLSNTEKSYFVIASGWADLSYCNFHGNDINLATDQFGSNNCQRLIPGRDLFVVFDGTWKEAKTKSGSWFSFLSFTFCPWPDWIMRSWQWYDKQRSMKLCNFTWENKTL